MKKVRLSLILISVMLIFAGGMFLTSCDKTELVDSNKNESLEENAEAVANIESYENLTVADMPQLEVREGMLYFANSEQYFKTIAIVSKMTDEELDKWEQELGFVSLRTMQNEEIEKLELCETKQSFESSLSKTSLFLKKTNNNEVSYIVDDFIFASIANKECMYLTETKVNKITENYLIIGEIKNIEEAKRIDLKTRSTSNDNFEYFDYYFNGSRSCDLSDYCERPDHKRQCFVTLGIYRYTFHHSNGYKSITDKSRVHVWGMKKLWTGWIKYKTNLSFWSGKYAGDKKVFAGSNLVWRPFRYIGNWSDNSNDTKDLNSYKFIHSYYTTKYVSKPIYKAARITASSRGVGSERAIIECGNL